MMRQGEETELEYVRLAAPCPTVFLCSMLRWKAQHPVCSGTDWSKPMVAPGPLLKGMGQKSSFPEEVSGSPGMVTTVDTVVTI